MKVTKYYAIEVGTGAKYIPIPGRKTKIRIINDDGNYTEFCEDCKVYIDDDAIRR